MDLYENRFIKSLVDNLYTFVENNRFFSKYSHSSKALIKFCSFKITFVLRMGLLIFESTMNEKDFKNLLNKEFKEATKKKNKVSADIRKQFKTFIIGCIICH